MASSYHNISFVSPSGVHNPSSTANTFMSQDLGYKRLLGRETVDKWEMGNTSNSGCDMRIEEVRGDKRGCDTMRRDEAI